MSVTTQKTAAHEALHHLFRQDTDLSTRVLQRWLGIDLPDPGSVEVIDADLTEILPIDRHADTCLLARRSDGVMQHVMIIESQTQPDDDKLHTWPYYLAYLHTKYRCPVTLLVLTSSKRTATWAAKHIHIGIPRFPSLIACPLVIGPGNVPARAAVNADGTPDIQMTILAALTHQRAADIDILLQQLRTYLEQLDPEDAIPLVELTEAGLAKNSHAKRVWRAIMSTMTFPYPGYFRRQGIKEGRREGRKEGLQEGIKEGLEQGLEQGRDEGLHEGRLAEAAAAVLRVLQARSLAVTEAAEQRVRACTDLTELEDMLTRAVTVKKADEIFDGAGSRDSG